MIIDTCCHLGPYARRPIGLEAAALWDRLAPLGITTACAGRLEALWFENPHDANLLAESQAAPPSNVTLVPVLDPTIATWREELDRLSARGKVPMVRLHPNYHGYAPPDAGPLLEELAKRGIVAQFIARIDDPRRQHRLAQVPDTPAPEVLEAAKRHATLKVLLSGVTTPLLNLIAKNLPASHNLWADTSQADGVGAVLGLMKTPLADRLVVGTHAPLFVPSAGLARVVLDPRDDEAQAVLYLNAQKLFK